MPTTGLVAASFTHGVNRNLDPHLHTHVVMANMVHGPDGRWSACDHRGLSAHRAAAVGRLRRRTCALGSQSLSAFVGSTRPDCGPRWRVSLPCLLGEFSSRAADIRRHMAEQGAHSARGARMAWAATRSRPSAPVSTSASCRRSGNAGRGRSPAPEAEMAAVLAPRPVGATGTDGRRASFRSHAVARARWRGPAAGRGRRFRYRGARRRRRAQCGAADTTCGPRPRPIAPKWVWPRTPARCAAWSRAGICSPRSVRDRLIRSDHEVWRDAARAIEDYRTQWGVTKATDALGADGLALGDLLAAHRAPDRPSPDGPAHRNRLPTAGVARRRAPARWTGDAEAQRLRPGELASSGDRPASVSSRQGLATCAGVRVTDP